jgi:hypothetical protein
MKIIYFLFDVTSIQWFSVRYENIFLEKFAKKRKEKRNVIVDQNLVLEKQGKTSTYVEKTEALPETVRRKMIGKNSMTNRQTLKPTE